MRNDEERHERDGISDFRLLKILQFTAVIDGGVIFAISYFLMTGFAGFELVPAIMSLTFAGFFYGATFYFGTLLLVPDLKDYIVSDDTKIKGQTVEMETTTRASGDPETDRWVASFVFARNLFGMSLVPILILGWLYFFG